VVVTHLKEFGIGTVDIRGRWKLAKNRNQVVIHCSRAEALSNPQNHNALDYCSEAIARIDADGNPLVELNIYVVTAQTWRDSEVTGRLTIQGSSDACTDRTLVIGFTGSVAAVETPKNSPGCKTAAATDQMGSYAQFYLNKTKGKVIP